MTARSVAITGAGGFVGSHLARRFQEAGWPVTRLSHSAAGADPKTVAFQLGEAVDPALFAGREVDSLVHCAYDFEPIAPEEIDRVNVGGTRLLFEAARAMGINRIVVTSSISAFSGCRSN
ncbi:MAG: NAD-dependent epimerase/dehydratase family protein, partial [Chloroflexi bacterium]